MPSKFSVFSNDCLLKQENKQSQSEAIIWYHFKCTGINEVTLKQINDYFIEAHLPEINQSRVKAGFVKSKNVCHGKNEGTFRLSLLAIKAFEEQYSYIFDQKDERQAIANLSLTPLLSGNDIDSARGMSDLYVILHCYENSVRALIGVVLKSVLGENWTSTAFNSGQRSKIDSRKAAEERNRWLSTRDGSPLFYLDWSDLLSIIKKYEEHFLPHIGDIKFVELRFEELERVRNIIAQVASKTLCKRKKSDNFK